MRSQQVLEIDKHDPRTWDAEFIADRKADLDAEWGLIEAARKRAEAEYLHVNGAPRRRHRGRPIAGSKWCPQCRGIGQLGDWLNHGMPDACPACEGTGFKDLITAEDYA